MNIDASGNVGIGTTTSTARLTVDGTVRFVALGAGSLSTDALGNVTVSSDERLKDIEGDYTRGLQAVLGLEPIEYRWNEESGYDQAALYAGFSAQNVQEFIPEAVGENANGMLSLSDRPIIAALVTAVQEMWDAITGAQADISDLQQENERLQERLRAVEAELDVDVPDPVAPPAVTPPADEPEADPVATGDGTDEEEIVEDGSTDDEEIVVTDDSPAAVIDSIDEDIDEPAETEEVVADTTTVGESDQVTEPLTDTDE